jgi:hypothetical protein
LMRWQLYRSIVNSFHTRIKLSKSFMYLVIILSFGR